MTNSAEMDIAEIFHKYGHSEPDKGKYVVEYLEKKSPPVAGTPELAKQIDTHRSTVTKWLNALEREGVVGKRKIGQSYAWYSPKWRETITTTKKAERSPDSKGMDSEDGPSKPRGEKGPIGKARDHVTPAFVESLATALAVFGLGVAFGLTAFALHGGVPTCPVIGGQTVGPLCSRWAWAERTAYRLMYASLAAFGVAFVAARWETVREQVGAWWGEKS